MGQGISGAASGETLHLDHVITTLAGLEKEEPSGPETMLLAVVLLTLTHVPWHALQPTIEGIRSSFVGPHSARTNA